MPFFTNGAEFSEYAEQHPLLIKGFLAPHAVIDARPKSGTLASQVQRLLSTHRRVSTQGSPRFGMRALHRGAPAG